MTSTSRLLPNPEVLDKLADKIKRCANLAQFDTSTHSEANSLSYAFWNLEESFRRFLDELLPKLVLNDLTDDEICKVLFQIQTEMEQVHLFFQHVHSYRGFLNYKLEE